jgi:hypothetical protein
MFLRRPRYLGRAGNCPADSGIGGFRCTIANPSSRSTSNAAPRPIGASPLISPLNIFGPQNIAPLNAIVVALETDKDVKVVVF